LNAFFAPALRRLALGLFVALAGGAAWGACFARLAHPWLAPLALAPLFWLLGERRAGLLGWLYGTMSWLVAMPWIVPTLTTYGHFDGWLAGLALLLLAAFLGAYHAVFALLGSRLWRPLSWRWLALPALWVALEWARSFFPGFPWNLAAYAWTEMPGALRLSSWIGAYGVSAAVVLAAAAGARLARRGERTAALAVLLGIATLLPIAGRWAEGEPLAGRPRDVRVIQPNIPNLLTWDPEQVERHLDLLRRLSEPECEPGALLLWPESAAWPFEYPRDSAVREVVDELARRGCRVLLNSPTTVGGRVYNSALLVTAGEPPARYDKRHLVPFGEYVPLRRLLPFLGTIARGVGDFSPADAVRLLPWEEDRLGAAICFEVVFPQEVSATVDAGATILVTITNDAWYGDTAAPWQHLRAAQFRAAENRRTLLRAAITGVSAVVGPDGSLRATLGVGERGTLRAAVSGRADRSPYSRVPWLPPALCSLFALVALARRSPATPSRDR